ncbi:MAG: AAA family ATPase, partial [Mediterraneibacter gnavus]
VTLKKREMSYAMTEELNTLRTNIQFSGVDKKVIVMTSSFSGEGKSTITYQLAKSLAELGKRVLLIDADMRKSVMVNMLESGSVDKGTLSLSVRTVQSVRSSVCDREFQTSYFICRSGSAKSDRIVVRRTV